MTDRDEKSFDRKYFNQRLISGYLNTNYLLTMHNKTNAHRHKHKNSQQNTKMQIIKHAKRKVNGQKYNKYMCENREISE